jgi:glutamate carboxypeptidase
VEEIALGPRTLINDHGDMESQALGAALSLRSPGRHGPRILLAIHTDTVFGANHPFQSATSTDSDILRGPGSCDAKGGLLVMLFALLALERTPFAQNLAWEVLLNPDEEIGSPGSAALFADAAGRNDLGLLFEPALPDGSLVASRKGSGNFTFVVHGRAAHAGRDSRLGRNAIHALARFVADLAACQADYPGIVINTGWIHGGGPPNIVPDLALCRANVRVETIAQQNAFERDLQGRIAEASQADGITLTCHGGFAAPPKPLTPAVETLLHQLKECGAELGLPLAWHATGGACDGNRLAAAGLPTVDSLGVRGGKMHTNEEFVNLESLVERTKLATLFLMRVGAGELAVDRRSTVEMESNR